jgi:antitoxin YokJ
MSIEKLLTRIQATPDCRIDTPAGLPVMEEPYRLPDDLRNFYQLCGGLSLAENAPYSVTIVPPTRCVLANPVILGEVSELAQVEEGEDISWSWYIIADCGNGDYLTIDLSQERLGRCYDSFHETYGLRGDTPIIARSFTELVTSLYERRGQYWYWLRPDFISFGDAYDEDCSAPQGLDAW